jgi:phage tail tape-measure protein
MKAVIKPEEDTTQNPAKDRDASGAGTTFGAAGGAIAGGVAGSLAGPAGTVIGALAGAAAGAAVGKAVGAGGWAENEEMTKEEAPKDE